MFIFVYSGIIVFLKEDSNITNFKKQHLFYIRELFFNSPSVKINSKQIPIIFESIRLFENDFINQKIEDTTLAFKFINVLRHILLFKYNKYKNPINDNIIAFIDQSISNIANSDIFSDSLHSTIEKMKKSSSYLNKTFPFHLNNFEHKSEEDYFKSLFFLVSYKKDNHSFFKDIHNYFDISEASFYENFIIKEHVFHLYFNGMTEKQKKSFVNSLLNKNSKLITARRHYFNKGSSFNLDKTIIFSAPDDSFSLSKDDFLSILSNIYKSNYEIEIKNAIRLVNKTNLKKLLKKYNYRIELYKNLNYLELKAYEIILKKDFKIENDIEFIPSVIKFSLNDFDGESAFFLSGYLDNLNTQIIPFIVENNLFYHYDGNIKLNKEHREQIELLFKK